MLGAEAFYIKLSELFERGSCTLTYNYIEFKQINIQELIMPLLINLSF